MAQARPATVEDVHFQRVSVTFDYPVWFTRDLFDPGNPILLDAVARLEPARRHRAVVFLDEGVASQLPDLARRIERYAQAHSQQLELAGPVHLVNGGEAVKNDYDIILNLLRRLQSLAIDRQSFVIAVGGGAVLDMAGFTAAICHRGVRHIRIPTTVLSQNDSGVGVKNGVNAFGQKNYLGTFAPPFAVINDSAFIDVLPGRDKRAGMAEAVKVALIRDRSFFEWLEAEAEALARFDVAALDTLIRRCAVLHMRQIAHGGDPFERGSARPLDYGHWSAHKLETLSGHELRHGEAVALGIAIDTRYSVLCGLLEPGQDERVWHLLRRLGFRLWHETLEKRVSDGSRAVMGGLRDFREHLGGDLTITLLKEIGVGVEVHEMDEDLVLKSIAWLRQHEAHA
jgi:3-dehydroquinate synthase